MSDSPSSSNSRDDLLAEFLRSLEASPETSAVLEDFCRRHPELAGEFRSLAEAKCILHQSEPAESWPIPQRLGEFRIVRRVGEGGMGEVYEAVQESLGRRVAVKIIRQGRVSPDKRERFLREQRVLAQLHQTHIVPIHTAGVEGPLQYFAMPFIDGAPLHHVVRTISRMETSSSGRKTPTLGRLAGLAARNHEGSKTPHAAAAASEGQESQSVDHTLDFVPRSAVGEDWLPHGNQRPEPLVLSTDYFRSVAEVMADAAEAVQYAHGAGVLHRDLKPSNIMVDSAGGCWLIDFGLAAFLNGAVKHKEGSPEERPSEPLTVSGVLGTPQYMAPEQCDGKADVRTDVWGLGVTLYELLTLRRAFDGDSDGAIRKLILAAEPRSLRACVGNVPADLAAICRKSLRKDARERYATAAEFAADLRRWLRLEPTIARPARTPRRVWLWARRNNGWAAAIVALILLVIVALGHLWASLSEVEDRERQRQQENLLMQFEQVRLRPHAAGWFDDLQKRAKEIVDLRKGVKSENLRDQYAAALAGLEAKPLPGLPTEASSVAFSKDGKRLLIGGFTGDDGVPREAAKVWEMGVFEPQKSTQPGSGPVAFRASDGAALQFVPDPRDWFTLRLWNVDKQALVREFKLADKPPPPGWHQRHSLTLAICADGSLVAGSAVDLINGNGTLRVWDVSSGNVVHTEEKGFRALAFTPDGSLLAAGDQQGKVTLWSREQNEKLAALSVGHTAVLALAFTRDPHRRPAREPEDGWLLAVGDAGGSVSVWDLERKSPRSFCRGSSDRIHALAFNPDGTALASTGRHDARLWDAARGQLLLNLSIPGRNWMTDLAWSPDGSHLAVSSKTVFGNNPGGVDVWQLEYGRGVQTLRGLANRVGQVKFSPDDRLLAALDDDWNVGIWELSTGRLLYLLEVPPGYYTDNAALAFSPNGDRFAFASGATAKLWDVAAGRETRSWALSPGINDRLAFDPTGKKLLLVRVETEKGELPPLDSVPWQAHPRVARAYDLLHAAIIEPFVEFKEFKRNVTVDVVSPNAGYFVIRGMPDPADPLRRSIKVMDGAPGKKEILSLHEVVSRPEQFSVSSTDPTGQLLVLQMASGDQSTSTLFEMPSGKMVRSLADLSTPSTGAKLWGNQSPSHDGGGSPLVNLDHDQRSSCAGPFNVRSTHTAFGTHDGSVSVFDLEEIQRRLAQFRLGWKD
jgi:serine/threonine protein kinase/WD40 repeat protein